LIYNVHDDNEGEVVPPELKVLDHVKRVTDLMEDDVFE